MQALLIELTALLSFWLCLATWQRDRTARGRRLFIALSALVGIWSASGLGRIHGALDPVSVDRLAFLAILPFPTLWLCLALSVRGSPLLERAPWVLALLLAPGAVCYALLLQGPDLAGWFVTSGPLGQSQPGPLFWLNAGYSWMLSGLGSFHFLWSARSLRSPRARLKRRIVGVLSFGPMIANGLYVLWGLPGVDPTPILLGATLVALRSDLFSGDLLQALPVSQHDLVSRLPKPLILTDLSGRVTEINPAAEACLAVARADALDRNIEGLLEQATFAPEFERWSLVAHGREAGFILLPRRPKPPGLEAPA
jgi:PAS domain-containing protein